MDSTAENSTVDMTTTSTSPGKIKNVKLVLLGNKWMNKIFTFVYFDSLS